MPKIVTAVTHEGQDASLNIGDRQVLIGLDGEAERCWLHLLVFRLEVSGLLTNDRRLASQGDDLAGEESVAVARGTRLPLVGWRLLFPDVWDEAAWTALRTRALALAAVHGVSPTAAITTMDAVGRYFADTSQSWFGTKMDQTQLTQSGRVRTAGQVGLVRLSPTGGSGVSGAELGQMTRSDWLVWMAEEREGPGRNTMLSSFSLAAASDRPHVHSAVAAIAHATDPDLTIFDRPSLIAAVTRGMKFEQYMVDRNREDGQLLKRFWLHKEETEAEMKRRHEKNDPTTKEWQ